MRNYCHLKPKTLRNICHDTVRSLFHWSQSMSGQIHFNQQNWHSMLSRVSVIGSEMRVAKYLCEAQLECFTRNRLFKSMFANKMIYAHQLNHYAFSARSVALTETSSLYPQKYTLARTPIANRRTARIAIMAHGCRSRASLYGHIS